MPITWSEPRGSSPATSTRNVVVPAGTAFVGASGSTPAGIRPSRRRTSRPVACCQCSGCWCHPNPSLVMPLLCMALPTTGRAKNAATTHHPALLRRGRGPRMRVRGSGAHAVGGRLRAGASSGKATWRSCCGSGAAGLVVIRAPLRCCASPTPTLRRCAGFRRKPVRTAPAPRISCRPCPRTVLPRPRVGRSGGRSMGTVGPGERGAARGVQGDPEAVCR